MPGRREALVCDVQRFSVHDGPGIRTTVFFKGCPLACRWCQNPETISFVNEPVFTADDCLGCGDCVGVCPGEAIGLTDNGLILDRSRCVACLQCTEVCPSGALSPAARSTTSSALLAEVAKDRDYYGDDGGITLSGGEPLTQGGFLREFLPRARAAGLHISAETAGHVNQRLFTELAGLIDLFLFDLKALDEQLHKGLTGKSNRLILTNLRHLVREGIPVEVRMPVVPCYNDGPANLVKTARFLTTLGVPTITLLPYHGLGVAKLAKLRAPYVPVSAKAPSREQLSATREVFSRFGIAAM